VPCLMQMMQVENAARRKVLVEILSHNKDKTATIALARRALTDLNPEVRQAAARALLDRPREDYRPLLLDGLRYPWIPVATHAAETLAFVKDTDAVPQLVEMLKQRDLATTDQAPESRGKTPMVREVVRINHIGNCLLCHPPSLASSDMVRGAIPGTVQDTVPGQSAMPYGSGGPSCTPGPPPIFVRADATYLRQDFSVMHARARRRRRRSHSQRRVAFPRPGSKFATRCNTRCGKSPGKSIDSTGL
jgi:HEAT repeats